MREPFISLRKYPAGRRKPARLFKNPALRGAAPGAAGQGANFVVGSRTHFELGGKSKESRQFAGWKNAFLALPSFC